MPKTTNDLISRVLTVLRVAAAGQPIAAEDADVVRAVLPGVVAGLAARGVACIASLEAIDDAVFLPLADIVAARVAADYGAEPMDPLPAEQQLRAQRPNDDAGEPIEALYY
jgi:hypothetical protein